MVSMDSYRDSQLDSEKKAGISHYENVDIDDPDAGLSDEERAEIDRKLVRKLDINLIPWVCLPILIF